MTNPINEEALQTQFNREELLGRIARAVPEDGAVKPMKGLRLVRASVLRGHATAWRIPRFA